MNNKEKKELAYILYTRGEYTQKEIAEKVKTTTVTMSNWVKNGNWEKIQQSAANLKEQNEFDLLKQINSFNKYIKEKKDKDGKEIGFGSSSEYDALSKLTKAYKELESKTSTSIIIDVAIVFLKYLREVNLEQAQITSTYLDEFIRQTAAKEVDI